MDLKLKNNALKNNLRKITMPKLPLHQLSKNYAYWRIHKPHLVKERQTVKKTCGEKCFLIPESLKYPICAKGNCKIDCRGLAAAAKRSFLVANNPYVGEQARRRAIRAYKGADSIGIAKCNWK